MDADAPDWRALLTDYEAALRHFESVTKALTNALVDRNSSPEDLPALFSAEANARDAVVLHRVRLMNAWRLDSRETELSDFLASRRDERP